MVGTMKGFMVNEAGFAGSTPILALSASARGETPAHGVHGWHHEPFMVHSGGFMVSRAGLNDGPVP
jgi:hypothetical protein